MQIVLTLVAGNVWTASFRDDNADMYGRGNTPTDAVNDLIDTAEKLQADSE